MAGGIQPGVVAIGIPFGDPSPRSGGADLQAQYGADDFTVEAFSELGSGDADVALQALARGGAQLADPPSTAEPPTSAGGSSGGAHVRASPPTVS